ncbi:MAG: hypothetical protein Q8S20_21425, partial [Sulfuritalea sp.]|nr:hypothetical protein [Sulfuritalea sp.]
AVSPAPTLGERGMTSGVLLTLLLWNIRGLSPNTHISQESALTGRRLERIRGDSDTLTLSTKPEKTVVCPAIFPFQRGARIVPFLHFL